MLRSRWVTAFLIVLLVVTAASSLAVLQGHVQGTQNSNRPVPRTRDGEGTSSRSRFPVVAYESEAQPEDRQPEERKNKNRRYDKKGLVSKSSSKTVTQTVREIYGLKAPEAIPTGQSKAIIVGEVQSSKAHLSNDKSGVYTEILIRVDEILKNDGTLVAGNEVGVDRPGGVVRYPDGHERLYRDFGIGMPRVGGRYVLFLDRGDGEPNFRVVTVYELGGPEGVTPLDVGRQFDAYKWTSEEAFLEAVRKAIAGS